MNILLLSPWLPWPPYDGGRIRILETLRYLSRRHSVTLVTAVGCEGEAEHAATLKGFCENIFTTVLPNGTRAILSRLSIGLLNRRSLIQSFYYDARLARRVQDLTRRIAYDVIQIEFPFLTPYLKAVDARVHAKKILSMHNIESLRFERELQLSQWGKRRLVLLGDQLFFRGWETEALRQFDGIITVSDLERRWVQHQAPRKTVELIPNGVDTEYFSPRSPLPSRQNPYIVFTGAMDYPPNVDAATWFCNDILPVLQQKIPHLCFKIVGKNPHPRVVALDKRSGVEVTGTVTDIRSYIAGSLALVVPLRSGGGTRLKILEAMAMERPVISTSVGAEGLEITSMVDILIADDPGQFLNHVQLLLKSPETSKHLGRRARRLVMEKYDWRVCLSGLERLYGNVLGSEAA
ncbi:MAG TPA: glycosyltransferase [Candidatus Binatia bacterium]|nr:glycosyltransferase [Candidatus Binatia bacterium]